MLFFNNPKLYIYIFYSNETGEYEMNERQTDQRSFPKQDFIYCNDSRTDGVTGLWPGQSPSESYWLWVRGN